VQSIEFHDFPIGELMDAVTKLVAVTNQDAIAIHTPARTADTRKANFSV
jgi:hypothetical protein